jgi:hypothetical protein
LSARRARWTLSEIESEEGKQLLMDISELLAFTDEQWAGMSEEEKLKAVRDGRINASIIRDIQKNGSPELKEACEAMLAEAEKERSKLFEMISGKSIMAFMPETSLPPVDYEAMTNLGAQHTFDFTSSSALIEALSIQVEQWKKKLPEDTQLVLTAFLNSGTAVVVENIFAAGHNGIAIEGWINNQRCMLMVHQNSFQVIWSAEKVGDGSKRRTIGFYLGAPKRTDSEDAE